MHEAFTPTRVRAYYTAAEVADLLALSPSSVYRRIHDGTIPSARVGRAVRVPANFVAAAMEGAL